MYIFLTVPVQSEERRGRDDGARRVGRAHQADCGVQGQNVRGEARRRGELELKQHVYHSMNYLKYEFSRSCKDVV